MPLPIYFSDGRGRYLACNTAFETFAGIRASELVGKSVFELWSDPDARAFFADDRDVFLNPRLHVYDASLSLASKETRMVRFYKTPLCDRNGAVEGLMVLLIDITERAAQEKKLRSIAERDDLTGVASRREGFLRLEQIMHRAVRREGIFSLAMLDVDFFKSINDTHGHLYGDKILHQIAQIGRGCLRNYDLIFRYGGDEFLICLPDVGKSKARAIISRIRQTIEEHFRQTVPEDSPVTISAGVACYPEDAQNLPILIGVTDSALYQAKQNGRNRIQVWPDQNQSKKANRG